MVAEIEVRVTEEAVVALYPSVEEARSIRSNKRTRVDPDVTDKSKRYDRIKEST